MKKLILTAFSLISLITFVTAQYTKLFDFERARTGSQPYGTLFFDGAVVYGMTYSGGLNNNGVIFKLDINTSGAIIVNNENEGVALFPNPASDFVNIEASQKMTIEILDLNGRVIDVIEHTNEKTLVHIGNLPSGIYFIKANGDSTIVLKKFVKK